MAEFWRAATTFPAVLFTTALVVVIGFWLLVLLGAVESDSFDGDVNTDAFGLGGVPVSVSASLTVACSWFFCLTGSVLLVRAGLAGGLVHLLGAVLLFAALFVSWRLTRLLVRPLVKLFPDEPGPSLQDFIGLTCTIRTGWVDVAFGQAEVTARDGSTAVVQVRQNDGSRLALGSTGLLYAYDDAGEFFWVTPFDTVLDPRG
ncbi:hypothetical protein GCM10020367_66990 [Streptomyces sannanensis]|uniref:DUF1449 family protein n=1 Tax=Streptomyces sannanensis TaxID=285536 RepID=A0ABP6SLS1_9ACTN